MAGIIASEANNSRGIAGVCPKCRIINMRIMDGDGYADSKTLMNAVLKSVAAGAKIVSMSLGSTERSDYEELIFSQLSQKGIIFVAAAGNDGTDEKNYPAAYKGVIAVAATDNADSLSYFSNYGSWVDISAPGEFILSACGANAYCFLSGTSMATPVVSGVIGLMKSINSSLTPAQAESALKQTADPIKGSNIRINAAKALAYVSGR